MRRLLGALVVVGVLVAAYLVADGVARSRAAADIAHRIEAAVPGSTASVRVPSDAFLARLAVQGRVDELTAAVTGVRVATIPVDRIDVVVRGLRLSRSDLLHGTATVQGVSSVDVRATVSQASVDRGTGLPVSFGAGTVGVGPLQVPATVSVQGGRVELRVAGVTSLDLDVLPASLLPCAAEATITPGQLQLACQADHVPAALLGG